MSKLILFLFLFGFSLVQSQSKFKVPKALVGKWLQVDTIDPNIRNGISSTDKNTRTFRISKAHSTWEFFSDNRYTLEAYDEYIEDSIICHGDVLAVENGKLVWTIRSGYFWRDTFEYPKDSVVIDTMNFVYIKPNYWGFIGEEYIYEQERTIYDTTFFQRAFPIWRKE